MLRGIRERNAAFGETYVAARASVGGLRIVLDGSVLGPKEMGTQVSMLALIKALSERPEIASIGVTLPLSDPPPYAAEVLRHPKVDARYKPDNDLSIFGEVDVIHRPFHSNVDESWRRTASRIVMTLNDLIAYQIPIYHETQDEWFKYREGIRQAVSDVDGLIVISDDVRQQVSVERMRIEDARLFVAPLGVGHLTGNEPAFPPDELLQRGFDESPFLVVLGANYAHKNRGRAIEVLQALRQMGTRSRSCSLAPMCPTGRREWKRTLHGSRINPCTSFQTCHPRNGTGSCAMPLWCSTQPRPKGSDLCPTRQRPSERRPSSCHSAHLESDFLTSPRPHATGASKSSPRLRMPCFATPPWPGNK